MRPIDADALERDFPIRIDHYDEEHGDLNYVLGIESVLEYVRYMPTIETDRPQGEWKHLKGDEWFCSICGYVVWTEGSWEHPLERGKDYCEHCGADMRGIDDE